MSGETGCPGALQVEVLDSRGRRLRVRPESEEDLWRLRLVLRPGDVVVVRTVRDVVVGSGRKEKVPMTLAIRVKTVEFQPFTGRLRIHGVIVEGPDEWGVKGKHHSATIAPGQQVVLEREGGWGRAELARLRSPGAKGTVVVAAVDYDEWGVAVAAPHGFEVVREEAASLPGKDDPEAREEAVRRLAAEAAKAIVEAASRYSARAAVIVGPGPLKEEVAERVRAQAPGLRVMVDEASMGGRSGILEALRRGSVAEALGEYSVFRAEAIVEEFLRRFARKPDTVAYGPRDVMAAARLGAVEALAVNEEMLYSLDDEERRMIDEALLAAERSRAEVVIVPRGSPPAERIEKLGGAVALLRYPLPREALEEAARSEESGG